MKTTLEYFIASTKEINGSDAKIELLVPDVINATQKFIGLTSGKMYDKGAFVGTSRKFWDEDDLFKRLKKVRRISFWGNSKKKLLLKKYLEQVVKMREKCSSSVVALDENLNLIHVDSFKSYMGKITPKLSQESKVKREAYLSLAKACLSQKNYNIIASILENLINYDGHWKYESTFNFLVNVLDRKGIYLFNCFDWKFGIEDFYKCVSSIIKTNFDFDIELEYQNDYSKNATISTENFFSEYRNQLNEKGFDFCFKEEDSDSYILLICKIEDIKIISDNLSKLL